MTVPRPRFLGLIPARGGSKRLPRKNLLPLAGRPLLTWTTAAATATKRIDRVVLSTEDEEIAAVGREHGAEVPFIRPDGLATDTATTLDVVAHALGALAAAGDHYDYVVVLQPTSPLRSADDIDGAIDLLLEKRADSVVSVCETDHPPEWSNTLPPDLSMAGFFRPGVRGTRSQDLPRSYRLNGAIYVYSCARLLRTGSLVMDDNSFAYVMPRERSVDIDSALDFEIAQLMLQRRSTGPMT
jgi:CMP-N-acetylneuraminic acid synthetase